MMKENVIEVRCKAGLEISLMMRPFGMHLTGYFLKV